MPPIRSGSTARRRLDRRGRRPARSARRSCAPRRRRARSRSSARRRAMSLVRRRSRRSNSRPISSSSPPRPFSTRSSRKLRSELVGCRPTRPRARPPWRAGRAAGCAAARRARAPRLGRRRSRQLLADRLELVPLLRGLEQRPRVHAVRRRSLRRPLQHREVELADRLPRSGAGGRRRSSTLPRHLRSRRSASARRPRRGSARARGASRPRSACCVSSSRRCRSASVSSRTRSRWASATRRASAEDLLRLGLRACRSAAVLLEQLARLLARAVGLLERLRGSARAGRRSPSGSGRTRSASARRT